MFCTCFSSDPGSLTIRMNTDASWKTLWMTDFTSFHFRPSRPLPILGSERVWKWCFVQSIMMKRKIKYFPKKCRMAVGVEEIAPIDKNLKVPMFVSPLIEIFPMRKSIYCSIPWAAGGNLREIIFFEKNLHSVGNHVISGADERLLQGDEGRLFVKPFFRHHVVHESEKLETCKKIKKIKGYNLY